MRVIFLEMGVALLPLLIVWWTWPKKRVEESRVEESWRQDADKR